MRQKNNNTISGWCDSCEGFQGKTSVRVLSYEAGSGIRRVSQGLSTFQVRKVNEMTLMERALVGEAFTFSIVLTLCNETWCRVTPITYQLTVTSIHSYALNVLDETP